MRVHVRYFAGAREAAGRSEEEIELDGGATVADLLAAAVLRHPDLAPLAPSLRFALGDRFVVAGTILPPGATVALLPPVSGG